MAEINSGEIVSKEAYKEVLDLRDAVIATSTELKSLVKVGQQLGTNIKAAESTKQLTEETKKLSTAQSELQKIEKQIEVANARNTEAYRKQQKALIDVRTELKVKTALGEKDARQVTAQTASIKQLEAALNKNKAAYQSLATAEARATQEGEQLLKIIQQQDKDFKSLKATQGEFQPNVGNYEKFNGALAATSPRLAAMKDGLIAATKASIAFIATPLGAVLAAIALALSPLIAFLRNTGDGMDYVEKKTEGVKNGLGLLKDRFAEVGRQIFDSNTSVGKFGELMVKSNPIVLSFLYSVTLLRKAFPELAKAYDDAVDAGERYAELLDEINTRRKFQEAENEKEENAIKRLILQSKDRTKTEQERIALIDQALAKEQLQTDRRVKNAEDELNNAYMLARSRTTLSKEILKTFANQEQAAKAMAEGFDKADEGLRDLLLDSLKNLELARGESIAIEEKLQNQRDALAEKAEEKAKKREQDRLDRERRINDAIYELEVIRINRAIAANEDNLSRKTDLELELEDVRFKKLMANDKLLDKEREVIEAQHQDAINAILDKYGDGRIEEQKKQIAKEIEIAKERLDGERAILEEQARARVRAGEDENKVKKETDQQLLELERQLADDYIKIQIERVQKTLQIEGLSTEDRAELDKQLYELKLKLADAYYKQIGDLGSKNAKTADELRMEELKKQKEFVSNIAGIYNNFATAITTVIQSSRDARIEALDEVAKKNEEEMARELLLAGDNEEKKKQINEKYAKKQAEIEKQKRAEAIKNAKLEKALAMVSAGVQAALAVLNALSTVKPYPLAVVAAISAGVLGAAQVAAIASKPIPAYEVGTRFAEGGLSLVGEKGAELMTYPDGQMELTPSVATLMDVPRGTDIRPHGETMQMLAMGALNNYGGVREGAFSGEMLSEMKQLNRNIKNIKHPRQPSVIRSGMHVYLAMKDTENHRSIVKSINLGKFI